MLPHARLAHGFDVLGIRSTVLQRQPGVLPQGVNGTWTAAASRDLLGPNPFSAPAITTTDASRSQSELCFLKVNAYSCDALRSRDTHRNLKSSQEALLACCNDASDATFRYA